MTHQDSVGLSLAGGVLATVFIIAFVFELRRKLDRIISYLHRIISHLEGVETELDGLSAATSEIGVINSYLYDIESLLERVCGALGAPPDVRPMQSALTALRHDIDTGALPDKLRVTQNAVLTAQRGLDKSLISCAAQGELREVMVAIIEARDGRADTTDLRAKIEAAITALSTTPQVGPPASEERATG